MAKKTKLPADTNQKAKRIVDLLTGDEPTHQDEIKNAASILGRKGGLKGGKARAAQLTKEQLIERARKAAQTRWSKSTNK